MAGCLLASVSAVVRAQQSLGVSDSTRPASQAFQISGRMVDARSGTPLARCNVEVMESRQGLLSRKAVTGDDGRFSFAGLPAAKYRLSAGRHGYLTQAYEEHDGYSTAIAVGPNLVSDDLTFSLMPAAILSGTVTDDAGEPVRHAQVKLYLDQDADGLRSTRMRGMEMTDDRGSYEFAGLKPGAYFLSAWSQPWYAVQQTAPRAGSDEAKSYNPELDVAYPLTFYPDVTEADAATPIPVKGGERLQADLTLHAQRALQLRIPITDADMRKGYAVSITQSIFGVEEQMPVPVQSDGSGMLTVTELLPGHYDVSVTKDGTTTHVASDLRDGVAELSPGLEPDIVVHGTVLPDEGSLPNGSGIALIVTNNYRPFQAPIDEVHEFTISVPAGTYEVLGQIPNHYIHDISAQGAEVAGRTLTLKAGSTPRLRLRAGNAYAQIDGTVLHNGRPASAAMVLLVPEHPGENRILFRRDQSDSDGTFTLRGIIPGRYRVVAIERGWELEFANPRVLAIFLKNSKVMEVTGRDQLQLTVELQTR